MTLAALFLGLVSGPFSPPGEGGRGEGRVTNSHQVEVEGPLTPSPSPPEARRESGVYKAGLADPIDGEAAVGISRRFLARMGLRKVGGLMGVYEQRASAWGREGKTVWSVVFGEGGREGFYASVDEKGELFRAGRSNYTPIPGNPRDVETLKRRHRRLMALVPNALPVRSHRPPESFYADGEFDVLVHGLPFFNINPSYSYSVTCDAEGSLITFSRALKPPPVASLKPEVELLAATARLIARWGKRPHEGPFPEHVRPELGYYLVAGERVARLVWRGWVYQDRNPLFDGASPVPGYIDAATGEFVKENPG